MYADPQKTRESRKRVQAFTLIEVVLALGITAAVFGGIIVAYTQATRRAQWTGYSLAAQGLAIQQIEQARSAQWDPARKNSSGTSFLNEVTNLNLTGWSWTASNRTLVGYTWATLDIPYSRTNYIVATNYVTIKTIDIIPNAVTIQMVKVDTVWPFTWHSSKRYFTNSIATYLAPDNRDDDTF